MPYQFRLDQVYDESQRGRPGDEYEVAPGQFARLRRPTIAILKKALDEFQNASTDYERIVRVALVVLEHDFEFDEEKWDFSMLARVVQDFFELQTAALKLQTNT